MRSAVGFPRARWSKSREASIRASRLTVNTPGPIRCGFSTVVQLAEAVRWSIPIRPLSGSLNHHTVTKTRFPAAAKPNYASATKYDPHISINARRCSNRSVLA